MNPMGIAVTAFIAGFGFGIWLTVHRIRQIINARMQQYQHGGK
jgi:hypothetical protein